MNISSKDFYKKNITDNVSVFHQPWWLDAVTNENWDVAIASENGKMLAVLPYVLSKKFGATIIRQPILNQFSGPFYFFEKDNLQDFYSTENTVQKTLIEQLPKFDLFEQNFSTKIKNWLPFYWNGFEQTVRYTYVLDKQKSKENCWNDLSESIKRNIKNGEKNLRIVESQDFDLMYDLVKKTQQRQNIKSELSKIHFIEIFSTAFQKNQCKFLFAEHLETKKIVAGAVFIFDKNSVYYLMSGLDESLKINYAIATLLWNGVQFSRTINCDFDFEGSMMQNIEKFFRHFGAEQKIYFHVSKKTGKIFLLKEIFQNIVRLFQNK